MMYGIKWSSLILILFLGSHAVTPFLIPERVSQMAVSVIKKSPQLLNQTVLTVDSLAETLIRASTLHNSTVELLKEVMPAPNQTRGLDNPNGQEACGLFHVTCKIRKFISLLRPASTATNPPQQG